VPLCTPLTQGQTPQFLAVLQDGYQTAATRIFQQSNPLSVGAKQA